MESNLKELKQAAINLAKAIEYSNTSKNKTCSKIVKNNTKRIYIINGHSSLTVRAKSITEVEMLAKVKFPKLEIKDIETLGSSDCIHQLKISPNEFKTVIARLKLAEYRKNDRDFKVNDLIKLKEYELENDSYTGKEATLIISHIQVGFGIPEGYAVLSTIMMKHNVELFKYFTDGK